MQLMGRRAMKASISFADFAPHRYCKLSSPRQSWLLSGASIPHNLIRVPWISSVSPSITDALPIKSSANADPLSATRSKSPGGQFKLLQVWSVKLLHP